MSAITDFIQSLGNKYSEFANGIQNAQNNVAKGAANAVTGAVNKAGSIAGNIPTDLTNPANLTKDLLGGRQSPTIKQQYDTSPVPSNLKAIGLPTGQDILHGKATPASLGGLALMGLTAGSGEGENPEATANEEASGSKYSFGANPETAEAPAPATAETGGQWSGNGAENLNYKAPESTNASPTSEVPPTEQSAPPPTGENPEPGANAKSENYKFSPLQRTNPNGYKSPVTVRMPEISDNPNVTTREQAAQDTLERLVPGKTGGEVLNNIPKTMDSLGKQIKSTMEQNPMTAKVSDVMDNFDKNLENDGIYRTSGKAKDVIQKTARQYVSQLYGVSDSDVEGNSIISDQNLYDAKQKINADAQSIYKKMNNGSSLTTKDKVILSAQGAVDDTLTGLHPEVKDMTTEQSHLYDATNSAFKQRAQEEANPEPNLFQKAGALLKNPVVDVGVGALGLGGLQQAGNIAGLVGNAAGSVKNFLSGNGNKSSAFTPGGDNSTTAPAPSDLPVHMLPDDVKSKTGLPITQDEYNNAINTQPGEYAQGSNARNTLDTNLATTKSVADQNMPGNVKTFMGIAPQAYKETQSLSGINWSGFASVFNKISSVDAYKKYTSNPGNPYAAELQKVATANDYYKQAYKDVTGSDPDPSNLINSTNSSQQMQQILNGQLKFIADSYSKYQPYWDAINPMSGTTAQAPQTGDTSGLMAGNGAQGGGTSTYNPQSESLPPIPEGFQIGQ